MTAIYTYFVFNIFIAGMYYGDADFKLYGRVNTYYNMFLLIIFGGIIVIWCYSFKTKFEKWFTSTLFGFYWKMYVLRKYDNLSEEQLNFIIGQISAEKDLKTTEKQSVKLIKHLTKILERNGRK